MRSKNILDAPDEPEIDAQRNRKLGWLRVIGMLFLVLGVTMIIQHWPGGTLFAVIGVLLIALKDLIQLISGALHGVTAWAYFIGRLCLFGYFLVPRLIDTNMSKVLLIPAGIAFGVGIVYSVFLQKKD